MVKMVSLEKRIREQDIDVKTVCFGERTARKLHNEGRDTKLLGDVEKQRLIATELVLEELRAVAQQIREIFQEYYRGSGCNLLFAECKEEILGLLVEQEEK